MNETQDIMLHVPKRMLFLQIRGNLGIIFFVYLNGWLDPKAVITLGKKIHSFLLR